MFRTLSYDQNGALNLRCPLGIPPACPTRQRREIIYGGRLEKTIPDFAPDTCLIGPNILSPVNDDLNYFLLVAPDVISRIFKLCFTTLETRYQTSSGEIVGSKLENRNRVSNKF